MSSSVLRYIPEDPTFVGEATAREAARKMLEKALKAPAIVTVTDDPAFVDPGDNLEAVRCPACGEGLAMEWWQEAMSKSAAGAFHDLNVVVPCCTAETSLHDLDYDAPAGFAKLVLEVEDPAKDPDEAVDQDALEAALGCMVRRVEARY
jgi:hypothetical protein